MNLVADELLGNLHAMEIKLLLTGKQHPFHDFTVHRPTAGIGPGRNKTLAAGYGGKN